MEETIEKAWGWTLWIGAKIGSIFWKPAIKAAETVGAGKVTEPAKKAVETFQKSEKKFVEELHTDNSITPRILVTKVDSDEKKATSFLSLSAVVLLGGLWYVFKK